MARSMVLSKKSAQALKSPPALGFSDDKLGTPMLRRCSGDESAGLIVAKALVTNPPCSDFVRADCWFVDVNLRVRCWDLCARIACIPRVCGYSTLSLTTSLTSKKPKSSAISIAIVNHGENRCLRAEPEFAGVAPRLLRHWYPPRIEATSAVRQALGASMPRFRRTAPLRITFPAPARPVSPICCEQVRSAGISIGKPRLPKPPTGKIVFFVRWTREPDDASARLIQSRWACLLIRASGSRQPFHP